MCPTVSAPFVMLRHRYKRQGYGGDGDGDDEDDYDDDIGLNVLNYLPNPMAVNSLWQYSSSNVGIGGAVSRGFASAAASASRHPNLAWTPRVHGRLLTRPRARLRSRSSLSRSSRSRLRPRPRPRPRRHSGHSNSSNEFPLFSDGESRFPNSSASLFVSRV